MANKIYVAPESAVTFGSNTDTVLWSIKNVANGAGRISAQWDRGTGSKPGWYRWQMKTKAAAALAVGVALELWLAFSRGGSIVDGNFGTSDAAASAADKRNNLTRLGSIIADSTTNGEVQIGSGVIFLPYRYVSVLGWNTLGQSLTNVDADHQLAFEAIPWEIQ